MFFFDKAAEDSRIDDNLLLLGDTVDISVLLLVGKVTMSFFLKVGKIDDDDAALLLFCIMAVSSSLVLEKEINLLISICVAISLIRLFSGFSSVIAVVVVGSVEVDAAAVLGPVVVVGAVLAWSLSVKGFVEGVLLS